MSSILQSNSDSTSSEDGSSNSEGSDPTTMTRTVNLLSASYKQKQASIIDEIKGEMAKNAYLAKE